MSKFEIGDLVTFRSVPINYDAEIISIDEEEGLLYVGITIPITAVVEEA